MARPGAEEINRGRINIEGSPQITIVSFTPNEETLRQLQQNSPAEPIKLIEFDIEQKRVRIHPIQTMPIAGKFALPKYKKITTISIPLRNRQAPDSEHEVEMFLEGLPRGFLNNWQYGLGFPKVYKYIVDAIENATDCREIHFVDKGEPAVGNYAITIPLSYFEAARSKLDRIHGRSQSAAGNVKRAHAHNWVAGFTGQDSVDYKRGKHPMIQAFADSAADNQQLTDEDVEELLEVLQAQSKLLSTDRPEVLAKLRNDIELVELDGLISQFDSMLKTNHKERVWQEFLQENPFILSFAFGYPVILIQAEASVGGRRFSGSGEKITDFLVKNAITNNLALFEIKKPGTSLLQKNSYRDGVFGPSKDLAGSVTQALDQRYQLLLDFAGKKMRSRLQEIESFAVRLCIIIGKSPENPDMAKSFELFRNNLKDVEVITFDELLKRVKLLRTFLQGDPSSYGEPDS